MNIGFDGKRAAQNRTGLGNYSRFVISLLTRFAPDDRLFLFVPNRSKATLLNNISSLDSLNIIYPSNLIARTFPAVWRTYGIGKELRQHKINLYHGLSNELPLCTAKSKCCKIVTVHDVIFRHTPQYYKAVDRWIYDQKTRYAVHHADRVIAVSEYTKSELIKFYSVPDDKIDVVYQGQSLDFSIPYNADDIRHRYNLPARFILSVGTIEERKNLMLVAKALTVMGGDKPSDICVVAVGRQTSYSDHLKEYASSHNHDFRFLNDVSRADLAALYKMADIFVYPSRIEGFGIPMLEAATAGTAAIGCTGSSLEEAGGSGAIYVDADDERAMADAILRLWNDDELRHRCGTLGLAHAKRFDDTRLFSDLMVAYQRAINTANHD